MNTLDALDKRKSVRSYLPDDVEQDKIDIILKYGNKAPNAGPIQITVIKNEDLLKEINDVSLASMLNSNNDFARERASLEGYQPLYGAPIMMVLSAPGNPLSPINTACAVTTMMITATELGLGSCYISSPGRIMDGSDPISLKLELPDGYKPICGVIFGYKAGDKFAVSRQKNKDNINYIL